MAKVGRPKLLQNVMAPKTSNVNFSEGAKSKGILDDYAVRKSVDSQVIVTGDHNTDGTKAEVINVIYGTEETPPAASNYPIGTIYIQYEE